MNHLSLKSLAFYGTAIASVLVLFNIVAAYGESKIKALPDISGNYRISSQDLPDCLKSDNLSLNIEQSGIYLLGNLSLSSSNTPESKITLDGKLNDKQLSLYGQTKELAKCNPSQTSNNTHLLKIEGEQQGQNFSGKITGTTISTEANFTAVKLEQSQSEKEINH